MTTKKTFIAIAAQIARMPDSTDDYRRAKVDIADAIADVFQKQNPRFDREKFYKACGVFTI